MSAYSDALDGLAEHLLSMCLHCCEVQCTSPLCAAWLSAAMECERQRIRAAQRAARPHR